MSKSHFQGCFRYLDHPDFVGKFQRILLEFGSYGFDHARDLLYLLLFPCKSALGQIEQKLVRGYGTVRLQPRRPVEGAQACDEIVPFNQDTYGLLFVRERDV